MLCRRLLHRVSRASAPVGNGKSSTPRRFLSMRMFCPTGRAEARDGVARPAGEARHEGRTALGNVLGQGAVGPRREGLPAARSWWWRRQSWGRRPSAATSSRSRRRPCWRSARIWEWASGPRARWPAIGRARRSSWRRRSACGCLASLPYLAVVAVAALLAGPGDTRRALALLGLAALVNAFVDYLLAIFRGFERLADEAHLNVARALLIAAGGLGALAVHRTVGGAGGRAAGRHGGERPLRAAPACAAVTGSTPAPASSIASSGARPPARRCRSGWRRCSRCSTSRATWSSSRSSPATRRSAPTARPTRSSKG